MSEGDLMWPEHQHSTENLDMEAVDKSQLLDNAQNVPDTSEANEQSEEEPANDGLRGYFMP
jgi:hypothetical protein